MFTHYTAQDPANIHHVLPMFATLFGTLGMYWFLTTSWIREKLKSLFATVKKFVISLKGKK